MARSELRFDHAGVAAHAGGRRLNLMVMPAAPIPDFNVAKTNFTLPPLNALFDAMFVLLSRGDKSAIELFQAGVRGWDAGLRRLDNEKRRPGDYTPERRPSVIDAPKQLAIRRLVASPLF